MVVTVVGKYKRSDHSQKSKIHQSTRLLGSCCLLPQRLVVSMNSTLNHYGILHMPHFDDDDDDDDDDTVSICR